MCCKKPYKNIISICFHRHFLPAVFTAAVLSGCGTKSYMTDINYIRDYPVDSIESPDPSLDGPYTYQTYFYGSGGDKHRKEYGQQVDFITEPVDITPFMGIFDDIPKYWGFDFDKVPLNARVWFPDGEGPFPLVMIVHGNHKYRNFSDPGYEYIGTLLAGRGFIVVSVDENFLNQKFFGENDARALVLLEHLKLWKEWNRTQGHEFEGKVDMSRIALIGHSRGGESIAHAAAFNRLKRYPDNANITFNYNFSIKSIIAIAPSDSQYMPAGHQTTLNNINYLAIQGGYDSDVTTFMGLEQYRRTHFTGQNFRLKSAVYIYHANHSRFNSAWGSMDYTVPKSWFINNKPIMAPEQQRQAAKVLISAFLELTLNDKKEYLPFFKDLRKGDLWLPEDIYISQYQDSNFKIIADFEEDFDVTTTTIPGGRLLGKNLLTWMEAHTPNRFKNENPQDNSTVVVQWDNKQDDLTDIGSYTIQLSPEVVNQLGINNDSNLVLSIGTDDVQQYEPLDITVELHDSDGNVADLPLSSIGPIHPALTVRLAKSKWLEKKYVEDFAERILQTYEIPMSAFISENSSFDPSKIKSISFVFDRSPYGSIMLDDIGISN